MKKTILTALIAMSASLATQAQTVYFTNTTACEVYVYVAGSYGSNCVDNVASLLVIPAMQMTPLAYDMFTGGTNTPLSWGSAPMPGLAFSFFKYHEGDPMSCFFSSGASSCGTNGRLSVSAVELCTPVTNSCIEIGGGGCNSGCGAGAYINANLTVLGAGNVQVDFN